MLTLIQGHSVLKSSPLLGNVIIYRYRLTTDGYLYTVHSEYREPNGTSGEGCLYNGPDLDKANRIFDKYAK